MRMSWGSKPVTAALVMAMMCLTMMGSVGSAPTARASGAGPCAPLTTSDMAQPGVTYKGHASLHLSRLQGTNGALLTMSGGGWPARAPVVLDLWADLSNQFIGGSFHLAAVTTSATGALPTTSFRLPSDENGLCPQGITTADGAPADHVTVLLVAHTMDSDSQNPRARVPVVFTALASPHVSSPSVRDPYRNEALAGASMPLVGSGWQPGDLVTITSMITPRQSDIPTSATSTATASPTPTAADSTTVTADQRGAFALPYRLPDAPPLSVVSLVAHTTDARFGDVTFTLLLSFFIVPSVYPSIHIDRSAVLAGGAVTVTGDHWTPGERVTIEYCRGLTRDNTHSLYCNEYAAESLGEAQADSAGHFVARVRLPVNARVGDITMQARITDEALWQTDDSRPFAAAQPLSIIAPVVTPTYAQEHPLQAWLLAHDAALGGALLTLVAVALAVAITLRRRRGSAQTGE